MMSLQSVLRYYIKISLNMNRIGLLNVSRTVGRWKCTKMKENMWLANQAGKNIEQFKAGSWNTLKNRQKTIKSRMMISSLTGKYLALGGLLSGVAMCFSNQKGKDSAQQNEIGLPKQSGSYLLCKCMMKMQNTESLNLS